MIYFFIVNFLIICAIFYGISNNIKEIKNYDLDITNMENEKKTLKIKQIDQKNYYEGIIANYNELIKNNK